MAEQSRVVTLHRDDANSLNDQLSIEAIGDKGPGGAYQAYSVKFTRLDVECIKLIAFHTGDPALGVNGLSNEALLAIVHHRLEGFQSAEFSCDLNAAAMCYIENAIGALQSRSRERAERGVEGKPVV